MDIASRRYGDVVVAAPVGRIDHANADSLTAALAPLLESAGGAVLLLLMMTVALSNDLTRLFGH